MDIKNKFNSLSIFEKITFVIYSLALLLISVADSYLAHKFFNANLGVVRGNGSPFRNIFSLYSHSYLSLGMAKFMIYFSDLILFTFTIFSLYIFFNFLTNKETSTDKQGLKFGLSIFIFICGTILQIGLAPSIGDFFAPLIIIPMSLAALPIVVFGGLGSYLSSHKKGFRTFLCVVAILFSLVAFRMRLLNLLLTLKRF